MGGIHPAAQGEVPETNTIRIYGIDGDSLSPMNLENNRQAKKVCMT